MRSVNGSNVDNHAVHNDEKLQSTIPQPLQGANTKPQGHLNLTQLFHMYSAAIQSGLHNQTYPSIQLGILKIEQERGSSADGK